METLINSDCLVRRAILDETFLMHQVKGTVSVVLSDPTCKIALFKMMPL